jgi:hypothetical protein
MRYRKPISRKASRKQFKRSAGYNPKNLAPPPMRGGIRL